MAQESFDSQFFRNDRSEPEGSKASRINTQMHPLKLAKNWEKRKERGMSKEKPNGFSGPIRVELSGITKIDTCDVRVIGDS